MNDHVFICYSRKDESFVFRLAANLKNKGVPIWLDQWDIPSGANWNQTIEEALNECSRLLVVLSPSSIESEEVEAEWRTALNDKKVVIPVLHRPCDIPYRLNPIQFIDFTSRNPDDIEAFEQVLIACANTVANPIEKTKRKSVLIVGCDPNTYDKKLQDFNRIVERLDALKNEIAGTERMYQSNKEFHRFILNNTHKESRDFQSRALEFNEKMMLDRLNMKKIIQDESRLKCMELKYSLEMYKAIGDPASLKEVEDKIKDITRMLDEIG